MTGTEDRRTPLVESLLLVLLIIPLALWTVTAHVIGLGFSGNFHQLIGWSWWIPLATPWIFRWMRIRPDPSESGSLPAMYTPGLPIDWHALATALTLVAMFALATLYLPNSRLHLFWLLAMLFLGQAWWSCRNLTDTHVGLPGPPAPLKRKEQRIFWMVVILAVVATAITHRPDSDDQYYSNLAVMTLEHPERPLLSWNQMIWSNENLQWLLVDRLPSFELLAAALANLGDLEPIVVSHQILAPLFAAFTVLAHAMLLRQIAPTLWLQALIADIFLLWTLGGETRAGYGIFSFVQLHFGKTVLFVTLPPILIVFALRFMHSGRAHDWWMLFLTQIAALGCSSSALFLAPTTVGVALLSQWEPTARSTQRLVSGTISSLYPLSIGILLLTSMQHTMDTMAWPLLSVEQNLARVFGSGVHLWLCLATLIGTWSLLSDPRARRILLGLSLAFTAFCLNPFLYPWLASHLTGPLTTWRLFFALPLTAWMALAFISLSADRHPEKVPPSPLTVLIGVLILLILSFQPEWRSFWGEPLSLSVILLVLLHVTRIVPRWKVHLHSFILMSLLVSAIHLGPPPRKTALQPSRAQIGFPGIKAPEQEFSVARQVIRLAPKNRSALLPEEIGTWVTTLRHHPPLVAIGKSYLEQTKLGSEDLARRLALFEYIAGRKRPDEAVSRLKEGIERYAIGILVLHRTHPWKEEIAALLDALAYRPHRAGEYLIWRLDDHTSPDEVESDKGT
ncbi:MAG: DUF6077 domain-containing protein [Magnetococcus sp. YQC-9]